MTFDLLASVKEFLNDNLLGSIAAKTDETDVAVKQVTQILVPVCGHALAAQSVSQPAEALNVVQFAHNNNVLDHVIRIANNTGDWKAKSDYLVNSVFGNTASVVSATLASQNGLKESSVTKLLNLVLPIVTGVIGKIARSSRMNMHDLAALLAEHSATWKSLIPASVNIDALMTSSASAKPKPAGTENPGADIKIIEPKTISMTEQVRPRKIEPYTEKEKPVAVENTTAANTAAEPSFVFNLNEKQKKRRGAGWLIALLILGLMGVGAWWLWQNYQKNKLVVDPQKQEEVKVPLIDSGRLTDSLNKLKASEVKGRYDSLTGTYIYETGELGEIKLPNNAGVLKTGDHSSEKQLLDMLSNNAWKPSETDKSKDWKHFDRIFFKSGFYDVTPESVQQIKNFAAILKAYPTAKLKIGGYTDNSGDAAANKQLSSNRAQMLKNRLIAEGIEASRIVSEGFGQEFPVCPENNNAACKAQNRRVDFRLLSK